MGRRARGIVRTHRNHSEVRFDDQLYGALAEFASRNDLTLNASIRVLVERALAAPTSAVGAEPSLGQQVKTLGLSSLACLIAAEQNQQLLVSLLPDGAEHADELWERAASSARERLIRLERALAEDLS